MHLARVTVATEGLDRRALYQLMKGDAYGNHQLLWQLFPGYEDRPFLFRQEFERAAADGEARARGLPLFYVLASDEPQPVPGLLRCETKPFAPQLRTGQRLAFRLRVNPVVARREEGRKNSRRHDVLMDAKRSAHAEGETGRAAVNARMDAAAREWLGDAERAASRGYHLTTDPEVSAYQQHVLRRRGREIRFSSVDLDGILEVTDPERFGRNLRQGIGHSRAFGCGMWLIRRAGP